MIKQQMINKLKKYNDVYATTSRKILSYYRRRDVLRSISAADDAVMQNLAMLHRSLNTKTSYLVHFYEEIFPGYFELLTQLF